MTSSCDNTTGNNRIEKKNCDDKNRIEPSSCNDGGGYAALGEGSDTEGRKYNSIDEMWKEQEQGAHWYDRAARYYEENCPTSIDGVLGGFGSISQCDLDGSKAFLQDVQNLQQQDASVVVADFSKGASCECGAGIGRVTKGLLLSLTNECDLVESSPRLLQAAPDYIGDNDGAASKCRYYCTGLQDWDPKPNRYSIIWIQWVLCYLTDVDVVEFLRKCGTALIEGGIICLKENTCDDETFKVDVEDASVTRSLPYCYKLIEDAGLRVVLEKIQADFPEEIFPVPMLALQPQQQTQREP